MKAHRFFFDGAMLERGFWLCVWHVTCGRKSFIYVGRTGDSSSRYAASPFSRLGQHLDVRPKAAANMLLRHMYAAGLSLLGSKYELFAVGPIYPEQANLDDHRRHRDIVAPLEAALAKHVEGRGYTVVGRHSSKHPLDRALFAKVLRVAKPMLNALSANKEIARTRDRESTRLTSRQPRRSLRPLRSGK